MPNRVISDKTWKSRKVRDIQPLKFRPEYAWLIPLFEDTGVCEFDPEYIYAAAYSTARPDWTLEDVKLLLDELVRVQLFFRYEAGNKVYLYLVGSDKPGLLPKPSERYSKLPTPDGAAMARAASGSAAGSPREIATGLGLGIGSGSGRGEHAADNSKGKIFQIED